MRTQIKCSKCESENDITSLVCSECKHYLRDRIVNIDIWKNFYEILESPEKAVKKIVLAEHKNYLFPLLFIIALKTAIIFSILSNMINPDNFFKRTITQMGVFVFSIIIISIGYKFYISYKHTKVKYKDILASFVYSFWVFAFSLFILTIIEYALFGQYFFTFEFSPIDLKPEAFYILMFLEFIPFIFSAMFLYQLFKYLTGEKFFSFLHSFAILFFILGLQVINMLGYF